VPKLCIYGGSGEIFSGAFAEQDLEGNRNPQGGAAEAEERVAAGRMNCPDAVPEQRRDRQTADTRQSKVFICTLAAEVRHKSSDINLAKDSARRWNLATAVAYLEAVIGLPQRARGQVAETSRIVSINGHE
jgi:hypothetical protein